MNSGIPILRWVRVVVLVSVAAAGAASAQQRAADTVKTVELREGLMLGPLGRRGRQPFHQDPIQHLIATGHWTAPRAGQEVTLPDGRTLHWTEIRAGDDGWFSHEQLRGGYLYIEADSVEDQVALLDASGHRAVYVNGEIRTGDPYRNGLVRLPVQLRGGRNELVFHAGRGKLRAALVAPPAPQFVDTRDATLPDLIAGQAVSAMGAVLVVNATSEMASGLILHATGSDAACRGRTNIDPLPPLSVRKVPFFISGSAPPPEGEDAKIDLMLRRAAALGHPASVTLRIRRPLQSHKRTFVSRIDGSVQYYAVRPAKGQTAGAGRAAALVLTLHGAGVEATGQVDAYASKNWAHIVAPTNRRPFGFDWEDWGRLDALEVLGLAQKSLRADPQRVYLTGHSMGGHGTWQLGATFPDRFAAIGPSAGWISFWSYAGAPRQDAESPVGRILQRAVQASDTLELSPNYLHQGIYVLHGADDDNVPVEQARRMREHLEPLHQDFMYHEQPSAGHWWDDSDEPGAGCVDWKPMFDFFAEHRIPRAAAVREIHFATASPGVSPSCHWVSIEAQHHPLELSEVDVHYDPAARRFAGTTKNVSRLSFDLGALRAGPAVRVTLDGQQLKSQRPPADHALRLEQDAGKWRFLPDRPSAFLKGPHRYGPFKQVFDNSVVLVYGTVGTKQERRWAVAKARYDAETFLYRGNGSFDVIPDKVFDPSLSVDRNVVLYGNAQTNSAWGGLLAECPVQIERRGVRVGDRSWQGEDLGALLVYPRPGSDRAVVGVVGGSGLTGMRLTDRLGYFVSGIGYPDCIVFDSQVLRDAQAGIKAAGFFGSDWKIESGDFAFQQ